MNLRLLREYGLILQCGVILNGASWGPANASVRGVSEVKDLLLFFCPHHHNVGDFPIIR